MIAQSRDDKIIELTQRIEEAQNIADAFDALADEIAGATVPKQSWTLIWQSVIDRLRADSRAADDTAKSASDHRRQLYAANEAAQRWEAMHQDQESD